MLLGGYSQTGPRDANEDSYFAQSLLHQGSIANGVDTFLMVSDGMGGYKGGDVASGMVVRSAEHYLGNVLELAKDNRISFDPALALEEIVCNAHDAIVLEAQARGNANMGATFVGVFMSPTHAWIGHVGDSRAYLWRDGCLQRLTQDHSLVGRLLSQHVISEQESQTHPDRHRIERAVGFSNHEVEITEVDLLPGDGMVLCTDGVYTTLDARGMAACARRSSGPDAVARAMVRKALSNGSDDNATAVVALSDVPPRAPGRQGEAKTQRMVPLGQSEPASMRGGATERMDRTPRTRRKAPVERERIREGRASGEGSASRKATALVAFSAIIVILTIVVLLACKVMGPVGGATGASPHAGGEPSGMVAHAPNDPDNDSANTDESEQQGENQDPAPGEDPAHMAEYLVGAGAVLRYVDIGGMAYRLQDNPGISLDVLLDEGSLVVASTQTDGFGREGREYRQLSDDYLQGVLRDLDRHAQGSTAYTSSLCGMVDRDAYATLIEELSAMDAAQVRDALAHLALDAGDLTAVE
ncbi:MAG: protein phosphatase 2C domain-containing protein [Coriobacteriales bacterium]|nr:protein phosphatase 2C domain-containing protein [Coriobacteriales bacterium]